MNRANKKTLSHIPQNGFKVKELRDSQGYTQADMANALETPLKPHMRAGFTIQQSDISRMEREETPLDIPELLAYASVFNVDIGAILKPHFQGLYQSEIRLQRFATDKAADRYLCDMENEGRILAFSHFPSSFFYTEHDTARFQQIAQPGYAETEIYTLDSYLSFIFSPISRYSNDEKISILTRYIEYFRGSFIKHLRFFSRTAFPTMSRFPNLELLPAKSTLIMLAPVMQYEQGDVFLEIRSKEICQEVSDFYHFKVEKLDADISLLKIGLQALEMMQNDGSRDDALIFFYQEVVSRSHDDRTAILENFSPDTQTMLKRQVGIGTKK